MNPSNNSYIDVNFNEINSSNKQINGEPLYFTTTQVATMLNISDSKVRYYSNRFSDILQIKISNKHRRYTKTDIEKIKFIIDLANDGLTLRQIEEYCSEKSIDKVEKDLIVEDNPLQIQVFMKALTEELRKQLNDSLYNFKLDIINQINEKLSDQNLLYEKNIDKLKEELVITLDECCMKKLDDKFEEITTCLNEQEKRIEERDIKMVNKLKQSMEDNRKKNEIEKQNKKGFFSKLFHKK